MRTLYAAVITVVTAVGVVIPTILSQIDMQQPEAEPIKVSTAGDTGEYHQRFVPLTPEEKRRNLSYFVSQAYKIPYDRATSIVDQADISAQSEGVQLSLVLGIIAQESRFKPEAISSRGAQGLMQVLPDVHADLTAKLLTKDQTLFDIQPNVRTGTRIIADYVREASGDLQSALVRYSGNATNYADKVFKHKARFDRILDTNQV